jgi:protein CpxP
MKTWIRRTLLAAMGASIVVGGLAACGHRPHHGANWSAEDRAKFREKAVERVSSRLDLDAHQKQRLGVLLDRLQEQRTAIMGATDPHAEVRSLVAGEKFDRTKAQAFVTDKTAAVGAKSPEVIAALGDFYDSLKPDQQAKVRAMLERRQRWWRS